VKICLFWRLLLGYSAILLLAVALSAYSILKLGGLSAAARATLESDTRRIAVVETMTEAFLSEARYAGRYLITHSRELYEQYRQFHGDFGRSMKTLQALSTSTEIQIRLSRVGNLHLRYNDLFEQEVKYVQSAQPYGESRYKQEKEKVLEGTLSELELLKTHSQQHLENKLKEMDRAASTGRDLAIATTLLLVGFGFALCYRISQSITTPLLELQRSATTNEICPNADPNYSRIPEIQALSEALRSAKDHLRVAHASNAAFAQAISSEFATPLISLKNRLNYLNTSLEETATAEQRSTLLVLANETEGLIQRCVTLQVPAAPSIKLSEAQSGLKTSQARAADPALSAQKFVMLAETARRVRNSLRSKYKGKDRNHEQI
jgi:CHASE3 domain sensor protein